MGPVPFFSFYATEIVQHKFMISSGMVVLMPSLESFRIGVNYVAWVI